MTDDTTPQDGKAMSPASTGSAASSTGLYVELPTFQPNVVQRVPVQGSLPQFTLTKAEREAIERAASWMMQLAKDRGEIHSAGYLADDAATLRGLLGRT